MPRIVVPSRRSVDPYDAYFSNFLELSRLTWDHSGHPAGTVGPPGRYRNPVLSSDQKYVAVERLRDDSNRDIERIDVATGDVTRVTFDPHDDVFPVWSPDGARIA